MLTKNYLFVSQVIDHEEKEVSLLVCNPIEKRYNLKSIDLSQTKFREHSYSFLDTTENTVFINVNHFGETSKHGHIYISDIDGSKFSLSLHNNICMTPQQCDFDKVNGLNGIYLANVINQEWMKDAQQEIQEEEALNEEGMGENKPKKKASGVEEKINQFRDFTQTFITYNKGGLWHKLRVPEKNLDGKQYVCENEGECSLNLQGLSNRHAPFYSVDSASGIIISNGNVGKYLSENDEEVSTFISRDGGLNWFEVRKGSHIYEIGNHGAFILMAEQQRLTDFILYSWDEGLTWTEVKVSQEKIIIVNIIIEPTSTSQHFVIYGHSPSKKGVQRGFLIGIDFSSLHEPMCRNSSEPNTEGSDYETWTQDCLLGKQTIYIRRKRDVQCYNPQIIESKATVKLCDCTDEDYECDIGYSRDKPGDPCTSIVKKNQNETDTITIPPDCKEYFTMSKGYRKIPGDVCINGINFDPIIIPCNQNGFLAFLCYFLIISFIVVFGVVIIFSIYRFGKGYLKEDERSFRNKPCKDYLNLVSNLFKT